MRKTLIALFTAVAFVSAACGGGDTLSENLAERIAEEALENELGDGNVSIDFNEDGDDAEVRIETDEGSITIGGGDLPDELTVDVPNGGDVASAFVTDFDVAVGLTWPASEYESLVSFYDDWTAQQPADFEKNTMTFDSADGETIRNTVFFSSEANITISLVDCPTPDDERGTCLNIVEASD